MEALHVDVPSDTSPAPPPGADNMRVSPTGSSDTGGSQTDHELIGALESPCSSGQPQGSPTPASQTPARVSDLLVDMNAANAAVSMALSGIFAARKPSHSDGGGPAGACLSPTHSGRSGHERRAAAPTAAHHHQQAQQQQQQQAQQQQQQLQQDALSRSPLARSVSASFKQRSGKSPWLQQDDAAGGAASACGWQQPGLAGTPSARAAMLGGSKSFSHQNHVHLQHLQAQAQAQQQAALRSFHLQQQQQLGPQHHNMGPNPAMLAAMMGQLQLAQQQQQQQQHAQAQAAAAAGLYPQHLVQLASGGVPGAMLQCSHPAQLQLNLLAAANQQLFLSSWQQQSQRQLLAAAAAGQQLQGADMTQGGSTAFVQLPLPPPPPQLSGSSARRASMLADAVLSGSAAAVMPGTLLSSPTTPQLQPSHLPGTPQQLSSWLPEAAGSTASGFAARAGASDGPAPPQMLSFAPSTSPVQVQLRTVAAFNAAPGGPPSNGSATSAGAAASSNSMLLQYERAFRAAVSAAQQQQQAGGAEGSAAASQALQQLQQEHSLLLPLLHVLLCLVEGSASDADAAGNLSFFTVSARRHLAEWPYLSDPLRCALNVLAHAVYLMFGVAGVGPGSNSGPNSGAAAAEPQASEACGAVMRLLEVLASRDDKLQQLLASLLPSPRAPLAAGRNTEAAAAAREVSHKIIASLHQSVANSIPTLEQAAAAAAAASDMEGGAQGSPSRVGSTLAAAAAAAAAPRASEGAPSAAGQGLFSPGDEELSLVSRSQSTPANRMPDQSRFLWQFRSSRKSHPAGQGGVPGSSNAHSSHDAPGGSNMPQGRTEASGFVSLMHPELVPRSDSMASSSTLAPMLGSFSVASSNTLGTTASSSLRMSPSFALDTSQDGDVPLLLSPRAVSYTSNPACSELTLGSMLGHLSPGTAQHLSATSPMSSMPTAGTVAAGLGAAPGPAPDRGSGHSKLLPSSLPEELVSQWDPQVVAAAMQLLRSAGQIG